LEILSDDPATGLNESGEVVGYATEPENIIPFPPMQQTTPQGFLWTAGGVCNISGHLREIQESQMPTASMIPGKWSHERRELIYGQRTRLSLDGGGGMQDLGTLTGHGSSTAFAINAGGEVVGFSTAASGSSHAFLWTAGGGMKDLGTLTGNAALKSEADYINATARSLGGPIPEKWTGRAIPLRIPLCGPRPGA